MKWVNILTKRSKSIGLLRWEHIPAFSESSGMLVFNTRSSARAAYELLKPLFGDAPVFMLSLKDVVLTTVPTKRSPRSSAAIAPPAMPPRAPAAVAAAAVAAAAHPPLPAMIRPPNARAMPMRAPFLKTSCNVLRACRPSWSANTTMASQKRMRLKCETPPSITTASAR